MRAAHGMARHRRQSPEGERRAASFRRNGECRGRLSRRSRGRRAARRTSGDHRAASFRPNGLRRPLFAGRGRAFALRSIFSKKILVFVDRAGCLCYNEAENSPMRSVFGERMPTDLVRAARFAAVGGIVCISLRLRRRGICRGEASPPPAITSFCMENIPLPRII